MTDLGIVLLCSLGFVFVEAFVLALCEIPKDDNWKQ